MGEIAGQRQRDGRWIMQARYRSIWLSLCMLPVLGSASTSAEICGRRADSLDALLAEIRADPTLELIAANHQYLAFHTAKAGPVLWGWAFTTAAHPAHPAVVCRKFSEAKNRKWYVTMRIRCGASKSDCDRLAADFVELNEQMKKSMEKR